MISLDVLQVDGSRQPRVRNGQAATVSDYALGSECCHERTEDFRLVVTRAVSGGLAIQEVMRAMVVK